MADREKEAHSVFSVQCCAHAAMDTVCRTLRISSCPARLSASPLSSNSPRGPSPQSVLFESSVALGRIVVDVDVDVDVVVDMDVEVDVDADVEVDVDVVVIGAARQTERL